MLISRRRRSGLLSCGLVLLVAACAAGADDPGEALREAARAGDLTRIEALLAAGVPIDGPARYGQTPLYFAAEKGHLAVARRLVERGANVNVQDGFFGFSVLDMALQGGHGELARYLLAHGAENAASALEAAIESDDLELARAALATGLVEPLDLAAVRRQVQGGAGPMSELLAKATAKPRQRPPYTAAPERLSAYAGRYRGQTGQDTTVAVRGKGLGLTLPGQTETVLTAVAEDRFDSADGGLSLVFGGRGGIVEWARVNRGGEVFFLAVVTSDPAPVRAATAPGAEAKPEPMAAPRPWPGDELIANGPTIRAYDPRTGRSLWSLVPSSEVVVATPVVGDGLAFVTAGYPPVRPVFAVRPGQRGDLSLPEGERTLNHVFGLAQPAAERSDP